MPELAQSLEEDRVDVGGLARRSDTPEQGFELDEAIPVARLLSFLDRRLQLSLAPGGLDVGEAARARSDRHQSRHAVGVFQRGVDRDRTAVRGADEDRLLDPGSIEHRDRVSTVGVLHVVRRAVAEPPQVVADDAEITLQVRPQRVPHRRRRDPGVEEQQRRSFLGACGLPVKAGTSVIERRHEEHRTHRDERKTGTRVP